jgi:CheY-like chemotaxis protein
MAEQEEEPKTEGPELADPASKTVLIVDDDEAILNLLEILVRRDGFNILRAESGEAALYKLQRKPDIILLDLILPGSKSGLDVLRHLRGLNGPLPTVFVVTGQVTDHPEVVEAKEDPNVSHFIRKPINQDQLLELMHQILKTKAPDHPKGTGTAEWKEEPS